MTTDTPRIDFAALADTLRDLLARKEFGTAFALLDGVVPCNPTEIVQREQLRLDVALAAEDYAAVAATAQSLVESAGQWPTHAVLAAAVLRSRRCLQEAWKILSHANPAPTLAAEAYNLGLDFARAGAAAQAKAAYALALRFRHDFTEAHINLGDAWLREREFLRALPHFEAAVGLHPENSGAWLGLGQCFLNTGRGGEALTAFAHVNGNIVRSALMTAWRASATAQTGDDETALALYEQALAIDRNCYDAVFGQALLFERRNALELAAHGYAHAHSLRPSSNWALGNLVYCLRRMAAWTQMTAPEGELLARLKRGQVGDYATQWVGLDLSGTDLRRIAETFTRMQSALHAHSTESSDFAIRKEGRLRIGYLSADFREHPTSHLVVEALEFHDRERFEVFAYALGENDGSTLRARVAAACEHFVELVQFSPAALCARLRADGIDVLVDLNGHTRGEVHGLLALRPAPAIANWLGYPGTLGAFCDYIIGDPCVTPPGAESEFSEAIVRLPFSYQANDRRREIGRKTWRADHALPENAVVACSFNQSWKFAPKLWGIWMRALQAHSRLVLWLIEDNRWATQNLRGAAAHAGIAPERIIFAPRLPHPEHLARIALADIALDTAPCNSHTTGSDALWMGVPMLTLRGASFDARVGESLLRAVGLPELVAHSLEEYESNLDTLLTAPSALADIKATLLAARSTLPLFDTPRITRALECAYLAMAERRRAGLAPVDIDVKVDSGIDAV
ncbi:MAG TPA: hypothetical protein PKD77_02170 [Rudaea sp.]|jgi:predicted O-linked N-acetylglucosamine transferase (SPINDLY family)|nr:hypothetical protein [Rudaea sp.]